MSIDLPKAGGPMAAWQLPTAADEDGTLYVSGQVPFTDDGGLLHTGRLEREADVEMGQACARRCAAHVLAQLKEAAGGDLSRVTVLKLTVFVASGPEFTLQPLVANGASELVHEVLGDAGRHARSAVGVAQLPLGVPVEVEAIARLRPAA